MTSNRPLTPDELVEAGRALFGPSWRPELARVLDVSEGDVAEVEFGITVAPSEWRARVIAQAQEVAFQALQTANNLLWGECEITGEPPPVFAPPMPRFA